MRIGVTAAQCVCPFTCWLAGLSDVAAGADVDAAVKACRRSGERFTIANRMDG